MLSKKFHFFDYGFQIYDEKSPIPFSVPYDQICCWNKNPPKIKKIFSKKIKTLTFITASQIQNKDLNADGVFVCVAFISKNKTKTTI